MMVELYGDFPDFFLTFLRERSGEVFLDYFPTVSEYIKKQYIKNISQNEDYPKMKAGGKFAQNNNETINKRVHIT